MGAFLYQFFDILFTVLSFAIIIRVLLTWIPNLNWNSPLPTLLRQITDPILEPARRIIPSLGGLDISPLVVLLLLDFVLRPLVLGLLERLF
jgi:YggT family protein